MNRRRVLILAEGSFAPLEAKTAIGVLRYSPHQVVAVLDSTRAGRTVQAILGYGGEVPVVASVSEAVRFEPDVLLIGIAPSGGRLPASFRQVIVDAITNKMDVWSGLHSFLSNDDELSTLARQHGVRIWDVRKPASDLTVAEGKVLNTRAYVVLTIASDCNTGKMTVALELQRIAQERGYDASFVATGQTGILIAGEGTPLDAVPGDFMSGEVEKLVMKYDAAGSDIIFVEGQGGLLHPGFGAVTLGLMLGAMPDAYVLSHQSSRARFRPDYNISIPPLPMVIAQYEHLMEFYKAPKVLGIALNTFDLTQEEADLEVEKTRKLTGLPTCDPYRGGVEPLFDAIEPHLRAKLSQAATV